MSINTPSNLELLLHCFYSPEPHPRYTASAIQEGIGYLLNNEMITASDSYYRTTEKGNAYIKYLMNVPFPVQKWEIPNGSN
jgi:hypothetical protein